MLTELVKKLPTQALVAGNWCAEFEDGLVFCPLTTAALELGLNKEKLLEHVNKHEQIEKANKPKEFTGKVAKYVLNFLKKRGYFAHDLIGYVKLYDHCVVDCDLDNATAMSFSAFVIDKAASVNVTDDELKSEWAEWKHPNDRWAWAE